MDATTIRMIIAEENNKQKAEIEEAMKAYVTPLFERYERAIQKLSVEVNSVKETANNALTAAATNTAAITGLENTVNDIPATNTALQNKIDALEKKLKEVETDLDDVRNRSMRGNLVIHGIPENENNDPQNKVTTHDLVANFLVTQLGAPSQEAAKAQLVRAHRSAKKNNNNRQRTTPRPIFIKFDRDDTAENYLRTSINKKTINKGFKVQKQFTKPLQERRNLATHERRKMMDNGEIIKGFVEYPAVLKVVRPGDTKYTRIKEF